MWKRFVIAAVLIAALAGGATATVALNTASSIAHDLFKNPVKAPKGLIASYTGGAQTYLVLGSDRRAKSADVFDRTDPPHSDTILLVRFDPEQGQTSVMSIPRDLLVNIKSRTGAYYPQEKINAAYTYGAREGGAKGSMVLAAETIKHEVFPGLKLNGKRLKEMPDASRTPLLYDSTNLTKGAHDKVSSLPQPGRHGAQEYE